LSLRKRMPPSVSSSLSPCVGWGRSGLTVETKPCLLVFGRHSSPPPWAPDRCCVCRKFQIDPPGDHLETCTAHSCAKKAHDWTVDEIADFFRTTHKVKTQQVIKSRGQHCGDIERDTLRMRRARCLWCWISVSPDRYGSSSDPVLTDIYITLMI
jgi:hypothetical protein